MALAALAICLTSLASDTASEARRLVAPCLECAALALALACLAAGVVLVDEMERTMGKVTVGPTQSTTSPRPCGSE